MRDEWVLAFGYMTWAFGGMLATSVVLVLVTGDVSAAAFAAVLACVPAAEAWQIWKHRPDVQNEEGGRDG